jgi:uncharacterized protein YndB with AHSA1/START domain
MVTFTYDDTFDYSAAIVFALLTDLKVRPTWIKGIQEIQVTPDGPARLGTSYFESGKYSGYKSEKAMIVTEYEQDRLLTLTTPAEIKPSFRESYRIEPLSEGTCRVHFTTEIGGAPKVAEFFMSQSMKKEQPQVAAGLKAVLASRTHRAG